MTSTRVTQPSVNRLPELRQCPSSLFDGGLQTTTLPSWNRQVFRDVKAANETPEVVDLRKLITKQNAALAEQRQRIEQTEAEIEKYELGLHEKRCRQVGCDYIGRAYFSSVNGDDSCEVEDKNEPTSQCDSSHSNAETDGHILESITACYRDASDEIGRLLEDVDDQLNTIWNLFMSEQQPSIDNNQADTKSMHRHYDEIVLDDGSPTEHGVYTFASCFPPKFEQLHLELKSSDDLERQQMEERERLLDTARETKSQLREEEKKLRCVLSVKISDIPDLQAAEDHRRVYRSQNDGRFRICDENWTQSGQSSSVTTSNTSPASNHLSTAEDRTTESFSDNQLRMTRTLGLGLVSVDTSTSDDAGFGSMADEEETCSRSSDEYELVTLV